MALDMRIEITGGVGAVNYADVADDLTEAYEALAKLPSARQVSVDFSTPEEASHFAKQARAFALHNGLKYSRKGDAKALPTRVSFRLYKPRETQSNDVADIAKGK